MSSAQMDIYNPHFLLKTSKKSEILQRLGELHQGLSSLSQEAADRPKYLNSIAAQLISNKFLSSTDKELRLLAAVCVVDVLRVYAPEAPYSDAELCAIFRAITRELKGLGTCSMESTTGARIFYILQSLSLVKSCVVLVYMALQHSEDAADVLVSFFDVLVASIRAEHPEEVGGHIGAILQECVEESDRDISPDVLCVLLNGLLPNSRAENPASYRLCQSVLRRVVNCIQTPISSILNKILVGASADFDEIEGYDLSENIYSLVYEVHKISPGLLLRVLPNVCTQLQAEELDIRHKAVKLLGSLFSSPHAEYGVEFSRNFRDFLGRFVDVSTVIREAMVETGALIMKGKPELRKLTEGMLIVL
jgi:sister-chromatid-cohesion protein PDS5